MFPNSSTLGHSPFSPNHHQQKNFFNKIPLNMPSALLSHQQIINAQLSFQNAVSLLSGNLATVPPVTPQPMTYGSGSRVCTSDAPTSSRGRKRLSDESIPQNVKRQRLHSHYSETTVVNQAVPLQEKHRYSFPEPVKSPLFCAPPLQDILLPDPRETTLPVAKDKLSQQILEWFQVCQQQTCDLNRKELCRAELQREIKKIFPRSRLFLVGSTLNGFGTHSSDGDLCLVLKEEPVNQRTEARYILSLIHKHFATRLSSYIERPQLIRAKVPIVKFRDKVSCMEFDLNVNNVVGIRNTFLLRTYSCIENRVRPLVVIIKKWASFHEINDASRGTLNSYSLVLMVLHYLQTLPEPILPSLQKNYPESFDPAMQLHLVHRTPRTIPPYISMNGSSLGDLLIGFLKYYATEFDWSRQMISVREAKAVPRPDGTEWRSKFICIEEPFDRTNTARAVHEKQKFNFIRSEFFQSWKLLQDKKDLNYILPLEAALQRR
ncbi:poly(A) RNA polymerase GLD2 isoform X2 [Pogoniulus pusillus]|uniref:poly(A) RNA polymerase GLD2 isoform X2 n=1 Tax=Pogoniulus pusillus TaxID=488313 RepID=UPI0030B99418